MAMTALDNRLTGLSDDTNSLDWRWTRAKSLISEGVAPVNGFDDLFVVKAVRYLKAFSDVETATEHQELAMRFKHEHRACDYSLNSDSKRYLMESLCLCQDLTTADIASKLGEDENTVIFYKKFFFDVDKLSQEAIYFKLFPPGTLENATPSTLPDIMYKLVALQGGYDNLNFLMNPTIDSVSGRNFFARMGKNAMLAKFAAANMVRPLDREGEIQNVTESMLRAFELDLKERSVGGDDTPEAQKQILRKCVDATHVKVLGPSDKFDGSRELTVDEMLNKAEELTGIPA